MNVEERLLERRIEISQMWIEKMGRAVREKDG